MTRIPRRFRTLVIPTIILGVIAFLILQAVNTYIQTTGDQGQIGFLQSMVGISQVLTGVTTAIISLVGAYAFLVIRRKYIIINSMNMYSLN